MKLMQQTAQTFEKYTRMFKKYKHSCPIEITAKFDDHFGIRRRGKGSELAGMSMHGSFGITLIELAMFGILTTVTCMIIGIAVKFSFMMKYKKR